MSDISRNKGNQTKKFGQLIEHNMRNIFLEKSSTKYGGETSPKSFFKNIKIENTSTITHKISEPNSSFHVKWRTTVKV